MAFLRLNGWTLPVINQTPIRSVRKAGRRSRSYRGQLRSGERFHRRAWRVTAVVRDREEAAALDSLLRGEGHFVDLACGPEASTSLMPFPGYETLGLFLPTSWGPFGRGVWAVAAASTGVVGAWDAQLGRDWTLIVRAQTAVLGAFNGYAVTSSGRAYVAGAESQTFGFPGHATGFYLRVTDGIAEIVKDSGAVAINFDDFVILPWVASDSQLAAWTSASTGLVKWGPSPAVRLDGDMIGPGKVAVGEGRVTGSEVVQKPHSVPGVGWVSNGLVVTAEIVTLDPAFVRGLDDEISTPVPPTDSADAGPVWHFRSSNVDGFSNATLTPGATVATWKDMGSFALDFTQAVAGSRPTFNMIGTRRRLESMPALSFDGAADLMSTAVSAVALATPVSIAVVWRNRSIDAATRYVIDRGGGNFRVRLFRATAVHTIGAEATTATHATALVADKWNMSCATLKAASSPHRLNAQQELEAANLSDTTATMALRVGADAAGANFGDVDVAEILVWNGEVTLADVESYLEACYGSPFPQ